MPNLLKNPLYRIKIQSVNDAPEASRQVDDNTET